MAFAASRAWLFGWDRFVLPWPGSRIAIAIGAPVHVDANASLNDAAVMAELQQRMERELHQQFRAAREALAA
jgi:lysophospholipid acyltransferase (LPLAT)-like uncharacterized protein